MLKPCVDRMHELVQEGLNPLSMHFEKWLAILESARKSVADMIQASPEEIAFTTNTSSALSLIARSISWKPDDRVLYPADDFPSNRYIWECLGVQAEPIRSPDFVETLMGHDLRGVKLVALSAVSYLDGNANDISKLVRFCHAKGILVAVDAIQAIGAIPVDMNEWKCDFLACGGQKWLLGPVGSGFLYVNKGTLPHLNIPLIGWASSKEAGNYDVEKLEFVDGARRFEPGLPDIPAIAGLAKSIEVFESIGWDRIFKQIEAYSTHIRHEFSSMGYNLANKDEKGQSGIVTLNLGSEAEAKELYHTCMKENVILTQRKNQLRISFHATVSDGDIDKLFKVFKKNSSVVRATFQQPSKDKEIKQEVIWKNALITGATQGLGLEFALSLARRGANLTLIGRNRERLNQAAEQIKKNYSVEVTLVALDLSQTKQIEQWLKETQNDHPFDLIIHNAAWAESGSFNDSKISDYRDALETNFFAPLQMTHFYLPQMLKRKHGAILNVVTSGARCTLPLFSAYASSKGALWSWSEALSRELDGTGVHVMTFIPPNLSTATNRRLARKALAYFNIGTEKPLQTVDPSPIVENAIESLVRKKRLVASLKVKMKIAINALFHPLTTRYVLRSWKGL